MPKERTNTEDSVGAEVVESELQAELRVARERVAELEAQRAAEVSVPIATPEEKEWICDFDGSAMDEQGTHIVGDVTYSVRVCTQDEGHRKLVQQ